MIINQEINELSTNTKTATYPHKNKTKTKEMYNKNLISIDTQLQNSLLSKQ